SYAGVGATRSTITPSDYRFYVSDVSLVDEAGRAVPVTLAQDGVWQLDNITLLDFENGAGPCRNGTSGLNAAVRGTVPAGDYQGVQFTVGVPFALNHADPTVAPAPLNNTAMFWNWQGGYKFIKFDTASSGQTRATQGAGEAHGAAAASGFSVHLGSTVCAAASRTQAPSACQNANRLVVRLDRFDVARGTVVADMGAVLSAANVDVNAAGTSPGCMSFPRDGDCPPVMGALGLAYDGIAAPGPQRFLTAR
ncbi:MAG: MbnP family copper-binding protein, partial [Curvibacter sp.]